MIKEKYVEDISSIKDLLIIDGEKCKTEQDLFNEYATVLNFPSWFGKNWNAFDECIGQYVYNEDDKNKPIYVYIKNIEMILSDDKYKMDKYIYLTTFTNFYNKVSFDDDCESNICFIFDKHTLIFLRKEIIKNFKNDDFYHLFFSNIYWNDDIGEKIFISEKFIEEIKNSPNANILYFIFFTYSWCFDFEVSAYTEIENYVSKCLKSL